MAAVKVLVWPGEAVQDTGVEGVTSELLRYGQDQESLIALDIGVGLNGDVSFAMSFVDQQVTLSAA
jgi:hypothetical protein